MKRAFLFVAALLLQIPVFSQDESMSRDRSRYANDRFKDNEKYSVEEPYDVVNVKQPEGKTVKNVILMIGDGMGLETVGTCWVLNGGKLNMESCPYFGISRTYATNKLITDSCAGGTALAIQQKTKYGYIACDEDGNPVPSILAIAQGLGKKTGISVTCRVNDATPADFCCHSTDRDDEAGIAAQYLDCGVDFISGGGIKFFTDREDGRNLVEEMKAKGYCFEGDPDKISQVNSLPYLGLFGDYEMEPALERGDVLERSTMKAIELMDNEKGFFLMVEGSCIDDYGHRQKIGYLAEELFDFDRTIGKVLEWAEKDGQTLVVITADHATGGLSLVKGNLEERSVKVHFSTSGHNGIAVPVYAFGPCAEEFAGIQENADISKKIAKLMK